MDILDFFEIENPDHLQAWNHLMKTGKWPVDFIPPYVNFVNNWQILITAKMADAYIKLRILLSICDNSNAPE